MAGKDAADLMESPTSDGLSDLLSPMSDATFGSSGDSDPAARRAAPAPTADPSAALTEMELRRNYAVLRTLQNENAALQRKLSATEDKAAAELKSYKQAVETAQAATRDEMRALRDALRSVQQEVPALREKLSATKEQFVSLRIGADRYAAIRALPQERVSLLEFVQARVHEMLTEVETPLDALRASQQQALVSHSGVAAQLHAEGAARLALEAQLRQANSEVAALKEQLSAAREERALKHGEADRAHSLASSQSEARIRELEGQLNAAEGRALATDAATREVDEARQREAMVRLDKEHLAKQVGSLQDRCVALESKLGRKEARNAELKAEKDAMYDKLLAATADQQTSYSAKLESEMLKWQQQAAASTNSLRETHEAQVAQLLGRTSACISRRAYLGVHISACISRTYLAGRPAPRGARARGGRRRAVEHAVQRAQAPVRRASARVEPPTDRIGGARAPRLPAAFRAGRPPSLFGRCSWRR